MEEDVLHLNRRRHSVIEWIGKTLAFGNVRNSAAITTKERPLRQSDNVCKEISKNNTEGSHKATTSKPLEKEVLCYKIKENGIGCKPDKSGQYQCAFCGKTFQWCSHWVAHERIHTGERPFKCEICNKAFTRSDGLKCHKMTHKHDKRKTSSQLNQRSPNNPAAINKTHANDTSWNNEEEKDPKRLKCAKCSRVFNRPSALDIHSRVHTGVKPYPCNICTKSFSIYGNLRRHLLIHTGERPYTCPRCSIAFNNSSHLKRHIKNKHPTNTNGTKYY